MIASIPLPDSCERASEGREEMERAQQQTEEEHEIEEREREKRERERREAPARSPWGTRCPQPSSRASTLALAREVPWCCIREAREQKRGKRTGGETWRIWVVGFRV
jgi:hypothetical protein